VADDAVLARFVREWRERAGAPGVSAAIRVDGQLAWTTDGPDQGVIASSARFPIYSITKTLTAVCVLRLQEERQLGVDDSLRTWFSELDVPPAITLTHLLRHTSGLGDYGPIPEYHAAVRSHPSQPWTREQFLDAVLPRGLLFATGDGWAYSNIGYMLLRLVLEQVTGGTFASVIHDRIATPLALANTFAAERIDDWSTCVPGFGSEVDGDRRVVDVRPLYHPGWCAPGVVVSTAEETTAIVDALMAGRLLTRDSLAKMLTMERISVDAPETIDPASGMGIFTDTASTLGLNYGHGGGGPGYDLDVTVYPESRLGRVTIAVFVNTSSGARSQECSVGLADRFLGE
jgi:D-alanyl-D-alanine carboxypeptidase